jgi:hypothetical protein
MFDVGIGTKVGRRSSLDGLLKNPARWVSDKDEYHDEKFLVSGHRSAWAGSELTSATLTG